jgi:hypothetical protein
MAKQPSRRLQTGLRKAAGNGDSFGDFLPEALEEFISCHHEEFLPVVAPG